MTYGYWVVPSSGVWTSIRSSISNPDRRNNAKLIADLQGVADRRAHYVCVLVLVRHAADPEPVIAEGSWHGRIIDVPRGAGGFGYDPHFLDEATGRTGAELPLEQKNRISKALQ